MSWVDILRATLAQEPPAVPRVTFDVTLGVENRKGEFEKQTVKINTPTTFAIDSIVRALIGDSLINTKRIGVLSNTNAVLFLQSGRPARNSIPNSGVQITTFNITTAGATGIISYDALFRMQAGGTVSRVLVGNLEYDAAYNEYILRPDFIGVFTVTVSANQVVLLSVTASLWLSTISLTGATAGASSLNANALRDWAVLAFLLPDKSPLPQYSRTYGLLFGTSFFALPAPSQALGTVNVTALAYPGGFTYVRQAFTAVTWTHAFTVSASSTASSLLFAFAGGTLTLTFADATVTHLLQSGTLLAVAFSPTVVFDPFVTHYYTAIWTATASTFASAVLIVTAAPSGGI